MKVFLDITDCLMLYLLISLWIGDFLSKKILLENLHLTYQGWSHKMLPL